MLLTVQPLSIVLTTVRVAVDPMSALFVIDELSLILSSVLPLVNALPMHVVVFP